MVIVLTKRLPLSYFYIKYIYEYIVIKMPAPVTLYKIEDYMGCGNVIIFDTDKDMHDAVVLNW